MNPSLENPYYELRPILSDVSSLLWHSPRESVEPRLPRPSNTSDYLIGMSQEESAFICGLLRERKPEKIVEIGANKGGTTAVLTQALLELGSKAQLYSVDINPRAEIKELSNYFPTHPGRVRVMLGKDISAHLEEIGRDIDFCILDAAHYLPGELLNFLCLLPYLKTGATVIVHDQTHYFDVGNPYVEFFGSKSIIACRVLFDTVVADKLVPGLASQGCSQIPNISSFVVTNDTRKYIGNVLSALTLPWRLIPGRDVINDVIASLSSNYPPHYVDYLLAVLRRQISYHMAMDAANRHYWGLTLLDLRYRHRPDQIAFFGAGNYCEELLKEHIPRDLYPSAIIDNLPRATSLLTVPVINAQETRRLVNENKITAIVISSNAHHSEIENDLLSLGNKCEITNPFINPGYSHLTSFLSEDPRYTNPVW